VLFQQADALLARFDPCAQIDTLCLQQRRANTQRYWGFGADGRAFQHGCIIA